MPRFEEPEDDEDDDIEDDDEAEDDDDEEFDDDDGDDDDEAEGEAPGDDERADSEPPAARRSRVRARQDGPPRGTSGMGRPSTGPKVRVAAAAGKVAEPVVSAETLHIDPAAPETEIAPDISQWPGTSDAAKIVGRHTSTIKLWRTQGRIRALQDASGCWRHHPDDLAESIDTPDQTDPGQVLAAGMSAIVVQGGLANERLIEMTRVSTDGLKETAAVLRVELERAYKRISELEEKLGELRDKHALTHKEDLDHERKTLRLRQRHELELVGGKETSERITGLLTILGPIAASIGARLFGDLIKAEHIEAAMSGSKPPAPGAAAAGPSTPSEGASPSAPSAVTESSLVPVTPIETRIIASMGRLCDAIRRLDQPHFAGLRAMMPASVAEALDTVVAAENDKTVGKALAVLVEAAQKLSDLQFSMLRPVAPQDIVAILAELREIMRSKE